MTRPTQRGGSAEQRPPVTVGQQTQHRVSPQYVEWVRQRLTDRDWEIMNAVNRLRVLSGEHIQHLFFPLPSARSRVVSRGRALRRLVSWRVLVPLERRIGGAGRGSTGSVFALDSVGQQLIVESQYADAAPLRVRRPGTPTNRTLAHMLAVSELYVRLATLARAQKFSVVEYAAEPACWWPNGAGGWVKPDAYVVVATGEVTDHWWVEIDMATESLPTLRNKLGAYLEFVARGNPGPGGVVPRVLLAAVSAQRQTAIASLVRRLPPPSEQLFATEVLKDAAERLVTVLRE